MAITASFLDDAGVLTVLGDSLDNTITASRDAAGRLLLNGGDVAIQGGQPTVANTSLIQVFGQGGADIIAIDEASGALPSANLFGGDGNDTLTGGSAADQLFGQSGNDILEGKGGDDSLFGGDGDDTLTGGGGTDQLFGEAGNDRIIWNPGDGSDVAEGGDGVDTLEVNGGNGAETFTITADGMRVSVDRTVPAPFHIDAGTIENIVINANGGDDTITAGNGLAGLVSLTIDGGAGNDRITGGDGNDQLFGGDGNDFIDGNRGNDVARLGAGDDVFQWDPGDGSDVVEGEAGVDTLLFNGANLDERVDISASGDRVLFSRDPASITMDLHGVEHISFNALGGADTITVNNLAGTDVTQVAIDLAGVLGGSAGDAQVDRVSVNATASDDVVSVIGSGGTVTVSGLAAEVTIDHAETTDVLVIDGLDGNDVIDAAGLTATGMALVANGGAGSDRIIGGGGNDQLFGGDGNDFIDGNGGNDVAHLGTGDDVFQWDPGDGSDVVEGEAGVDTLLFNGANLGEKINISANGDRALFSRDIAGITMDLHGVEHISFNALGGADNITVNNLAGTGVTHVAIDLAGVLGGSAGDTQVDNVNVNATASADIVSVVGSGGTATVSGLAAEVTIDHAEATDSLVINGLDGNDVIDASGLTATAMALVANGGVGNDRITGGDGNDQLNGGLGRDSLTGGAGRDQFLFNTALGAKVNVDTITDFSVSVDTIRLDHAIFDAFTPGPLAGGAFVIGNKAQDADDRIIYNDKNGKLFYDADGKGGAHQVLFATLDPHLHLSHSDFLIV